MRWLVGLWRPRLVEPRKLAGELIVCVMRAPSHTCLPARPATRTSTRTATFIPTHPSIPPPTLRVQSGRDAAVNAPTGSCKTLAYLPVVAVRPRISRGDGTQALIVAPTRELCLQVADALTLLVRR